MQTGTSAHPGPPSQWFIFHTTDTRPCQNVWPRAQLPFEVRSCRQHSIPILFQLPLPTAVLGFPSPSPFCTATLGGADRGALRSWVWRRRREGAQSSSRCQRVQQWPGCQRDPWLIRLSVTSCCAGISTLCKDGHTGVSPRLGLTHHGTQCCGQATVPEP